MPLAAILAGPAAAGVLTLAGIIRAVRWRRTRSASAAATTVVLFALAVAAAINVERWSTWIDSFFGAGLVWSFLVSRSALIVAIGAALALVRTTHGRPAGTAVHLTVLAVATEATFFFIAGRDAGSGRELLTEAHNPWIVAAEVVVDVFAVFVGVAMVRLTARSAGLSDPHRQGMAVMCAGAALCLAYVSVRLVALFCVWAGALGIAATVLDAIVPIAALGLFLVAVGCVYAPVARTAVALHQYQAVRRLYRDEVGTPPPRTLHTAHDVDAMVTELADAAGVTEQLLHDDGEDLRQWAMRRAQSRPQKLPGGRG
ncbi:hypothetical protein FO059_18245 (plasmid) [Tomitella fengzijianii]|uniref:Uncharacterized protein n=1 Tax=Tomitella fengzijianii TaxID=2597660 RepID=A0A516X8Y3_9ACTN|nr:hypothetical protein [Tomitella fengzijianii]QDQ99536.1 hypothetical protein FO059_18245 [Tomitella fengzijianii]